jgi:hypothetical protein
MTKICKAITAVLPSTAQLEYKQIHKYILRCSEIKEIIINFAKNIHIQTNNYSINTTHIPYFQCNSYIFATKALIIRTSVYYIV